MINKLYIFAAASYVVADEWNLNFSTLNKSNTDCAAAIIDANNEIAFEDSDLTDLYAVLNAKFNSFAISSNSVVVAPQCEYYKSLINGTDLAITIPDGFNSESRIAIKISDNRTLLPFSISYSGNLTIDYGDYAVFAAGIYYIMIYEVAGNATVKLIWTGE